MSTRPGALVRVGAAAPAGAFGRQRLPREGRGRLPWLIAVGSLAFFATARVSGHMYVDTYFDLYAGRYVAQHGIPDRNVVTAMAHGKPWIDQQWLAQLIFYRVWQAGGYVAVVMLSVVLVSAGLAVLGGLMLRRGVAPLRMLAWTAAALAVGYGYANPRAQSFGYLFVPLAMWLVFGDDDQGRPRPLTWLSVPLLVLWANVHGTALVGAGLVALHAACRGWQALRRRDAQGLTLYLLLGTAAAGSVLCTPYGFEVLRYYGSLIGNSELSGNVAEWAPPDPASPLSWTFFAVVIAVAVAVVVAWRRGARPQADMAIFAVVMLGIALTAYRNTPWFGFAGALLAADMLAASRPVPPRLAASFRWALAGALSAVALVVVIGMARTPAGQYETSIPRRAIGVAARLASEHPRLPVLADQFSAVGLLWLHPALFGQVAFDVRVEQYSRSEETAIFAFLSANGPHWQRLLRGYDLVVVSRAWHPRLARAMTEVSGWRVVYADASGVVLERLH